MRFIYIFIRIISISNFFLFKKALAVNVDIKKLFTHYIVIVFFQSLIVYLVRLGFINILFSSILVLLLFFNLIYFVTRNLLKNKDEAVLVSVRFIKYFVLFELSIFCLIWMLYVIFLFISKL